jgi:hypothetical protein
MFTFITVYSCFYALCCHLAISSQLLVEEILVDFNETLYIHRKITILQGICLTPSLKELCMAIRLTGRLLPPCKNIIMLLQLLPNAWEDFNETWFKERSHCVDVVQGKCCPPIFVEFFFMSLQLLLITFGDLMKLGTTVNHLNFLRQHTCIA